MCDKILFVVAIERLHNGKQKVIWFHLKMMKLNEKKFLTMSKRCCKIHIAVAKSDKKQSVKA